MQSIFNEYQTRETGLTDAEIKELLEKHGLNELVPAKKRPLILQFLDEFKDLMVIILIIAAGISIFVGENVDGAIITFILLLNAFIGFTQKYKAEKAVEALKKMLSPMARVIRNNKEELIENKYLVPGDILILCEGDSIGADGIIFHSNEFQTQEAVITGESMPVDKSESVSSANNVLMGTIVAHGSAKVVVTTIGMSTKFGNIARLTTETKKEKSPLEKEIASIGAFVGKIALAIVVILLVVNILIKNQPLIHTLIFAISVAVAAVPEGLPAVITICLALGVQRLVKKKAIIRQLTSVETLGSTTVILSDKTGTLTKNEMTAKEIFFDKYDAFIDGSGYEPIGSINIRMPDKTIIPMSFEMKEKNVIHGLKQIAAISAICNNAKLVKPGTVTAGDRPLSQWQIIGDPTEGALLTLTKKLGLDIEEIEKLHSKIHELTFDGCRKRMTVITKSEANNKIYAYTKGAPDGIINLCNRIYANEREILLDENTKKQIMKRNEEMASRALRVIAVAYKEIKEIPEKYDKEEIEKDLIFVGLIGIIDPPRKDVKQSIALAKKAGINIYIVTGDHGLTAGAIAEAIGLVEKNKYKILTGEDLKNLSDNELKKHLENKHEQIIFARVSPEDKLRLARLFKELNEVVAVTGDGVNDAPALKKADIGISMGSGTDVSKEAANMVLADDSISTIIHAIEEGRTIYSNIKKFLIYIVSSNIGELVVIFTAIMFTIPQPLTAVLILIINLGTDVFPALALGIEPTEKGIMSLPPRRYFEKILNTKYIIRCFYLGLIIGGVSLAGYFSMLYKYGWDNSLKAVTITFVIMVFTQIVHSYNARSEKTSIFKINFFSNKALTLAALSSLLLVIALVEIPVMQGYIGTTHLTIMEWGMATALSFGILFAEEIRKFITHRSLI
ncbi:cation-translocating P-type ATPase [Candidatus Peregrinibacteria bacterium]|nr:cation-translocating P-type ATPase [Candidatus Peregrinibacteria bacterium]